MTHGRDLEPKVRQLSGALLHLANQEPFEELISIIHRPGWTTLAEFAFFTGIVDSMTAHAKALTGLKQVLLEGSREVRAQGGEVELNPQPLPPRSD